MRASLHELRQPDHRVMRNDELTRLEQENKALRQRKAEIHNELLPEAQARVATLREEEDRLGVRSATRRSLAASANSTRWTCPPPRWPDEVKILEPAEFISCLVLRGSRS